MVNDLEITCGPAGAFGKRKVVAKLDNKVHPHTFDPFDQVQRRAFREAVVSKFDLPEDAHEFIETKLLAAAETDDPLIECSTVKLSDVEPEEIEWLWPERIAIGKLTLLVGDPGLGKSFITIDITARVSRGAVWPDAPKEKPTAGDVILLTAEDDLADTVRPRLDAHDADASRIIAIKGARFVDDGEERMVNLATDLDSIRRVIQSANNPRAIVIDPISAYLGKTDSHKNAEVRGVLAPIAELAAELRVAVIAVSHLRKGDGDALYRTMGSLAFIAAARSAWVVCRDKADPKRRRRLLLPLKSNIGCDVGGLAFSIRLHPLGGPPCVQWEPEPVNTEADEAIGHQHKRGRTPDERTEAADWLRAELASGPRYAKELIADGSEMGYAKRTVQRAFRKVLQGTPSREEFGGPVLWSLPNDDTMAPIQHSGTYGTYGTYAKTPREEEEEAKFLTVVPDCESVAAMDDFERERTKLGNGHSENRRFKEWCDSPAKNRGPRLPHNETAQDDESAVTLWKKALFE